MQSKGTLGSIVAGVIAAFLVLVCLFYLSFTFVSNKYEKEADEYALAQQKEVGNTDSVYNQAYKHYMDSHGEEKVYLGYTLSQVQKWGVNLGLDLKGGMNVILQVDMPDMLRSFKATQDVDSTFEKALAQTDAIVSKPDHQSDDYIGTFIDQYRALAAANGSAPDFGVIFNVTNLKQGAGDEAARTALKDAVKASVENTANNVLRNRIDQFGVVSPNIQVLQGKDGQILLELPGVKDHERVRDLLQRSAALEFYKTFYTDNQELAGLQQGLDAAIAALSADSTKNIAPLAALMQGGSMQPGVILGYAPDKKSMDEIDALLKSPAALRNLPANLALRWGVKPEVTVNPQTKKETRLGYALYALKNDNGKAALFGNVVTDASTNYDNLQGNMVSMTMNSDAARRWAQITKEAVEHGQAPVAIVLDDRVYSAPSVRSVIDGGNSQITAKVNIISDMVIGPSLGEEAIQSGFISFVVALVLLMIFMIVFYGVIPGLIANVCLVFNLFFTMGILASFQAVLTMSGIAGIVLSLGMAVDANVLIFERAKEELRAGKNSRNAIADGYSNAFSAIFDSNLTSIITGVILLLFGTGPIKGFATTLIIGLVCSFFTAVYLSRLFFLWYFKSKKNPELQFSTAISRKMFTDSKINFLDQRKVSFGVVGAIVAIVIVSLFARGLNQGIDFSGGRNYIVKFDHPVDRSNIEGRLQQAFPGASVSVINIQSSDQVRISTDASQGIVQSQKVGPTVADDMRTDAYVAVIIAMIAMFLYILVRFRNIAFSLGALAAVAFTAFAIIGFYSLFYGVLPFAMEIDQTFIAAILTVIGYQINDTVVVFDRVRENVGLYPKETFFNTINKSINSTLGRTIMTSCSTLLVLLCIFILGGDAIRSFVFAMIWGVIIGTLATIYVASPVAYLADSRRKRAAAVKK